MRTDPESLLAMVARDAAKAVPKLVDILRGRDDFAAGHACIALGECGDAAVPVIPEILRAAGLEPGDPPADMPPHIADYTLTMRRMHAVQALGKIGSATEEELTALIRLLEGDDDDTVRGAAALALAALGHSSDTVVGLLVGALRAEPKPPKNPIDGQRRAVAVEYLRRSAAEALGAIRPTHEAVVPALTEALGDAKLRFAAAKALAQFGPETCAPAIPLLKNVLREASPRLRRRLTQLLPEVGES